MLVLPLARVSDIDLSSTKLVVSEGLFDIDSNRMAVDQIQGGRHQGTWSQARRIASSASNAIEVVVTALPRYWWIFPAPSTGVSVSPPGTASDR